MTSQSKRKLLIGCVAIAIGIIVGLIFVWITTHQSWVGEQPDTADYFHKTVGLITDLPHSTVEIFWSMVENIVTFSILWAIGKNRLHKQIDEEHGYSHDEDGTVHKIDKPS